MADPRLAVIALLLVVPVAAVAQAPAEFDANRDIDYRPLIEVGDGKDRLDVFMPPDAAGSTPVLVFFHGGALMMGDKDRLATPEMTPARPDYFPRRFATEGIGVVMANYRLSPGVRHPVHLEDAAAALAWVFENIADFGGDPSQVFVSGFSAGGYLATMLVLDGRYLAVHEIEPTRVRGTIAISPFLDVEEVAAVRDKSVWGEDVAVWKQASPMSYLARTGPMLLIVADGDQEWRKAQNRRVDEELERLGTEIGLVEAPNRHHMNLVSEVAADDDVTAKAIVDFIRRHSATLSDH